MLQQYHTKLKGTLALTDSYQTEKTLQKEKGLYKFIWVRKGYFPCAPVYMGAQGKYHGGNRPPGNADVAG